MISTEGEERWPILSSWRPILKPGKEGSIEEGGDALPGSGTIGFGEDDVDAGGGTVGDPGFGAVEFVVSERM